MNRILLVLSTAGVVVIALTARPALAVCNGNVVAASVVSQGKYSAPVAGTGTVEVQVQVNPNGSHVVTKIYTSTNHGDDDAARQIADSSTYRPATCDGRPIPWFLHPSYHFGRSTVSASGVGESAGSSTVARIQSLLRAGQYDTAKELAVSALSSNPSDQELQQLEGVAEFYLHDYTDAADAFSHAGTIHRIYATVAAQAYASAAVYLSSTEPTRAIDYAQRAYALDHSNNSKYALGVAQLGDKEYTAAIATLQSVHGVIFADPHTDVETRYAVDQHLLMAYEQSGDLTSAQPLIAEMRRLEPSNEFPIEEEAALYIQQGDAAKDAKDYDQALALYGKIADLGNPKLEVIAYDRMALLLGSEPQPNLTSIKGYADKALAIDANDPSANFWEGYVYAGQYGSTHNVSLKQQALNYLGKADTLAKAAGEQSVAQNAEKFINALNSSQGGGMP